MTDELGVVVSIARWRAVVHYTDCPYWERRLKVHIPIPGRMRVVLCSLCRPTQEDLVDHTPEVDWYAYSPAPLPEVKIRMVEISGDNLESVVGRHDLGINKTPRRSTEWST